MVDAHTGSTSDGRHAEGGELHRQSFVPLYFQLAEILKERIEAGEWQAGDRFLSERELCDEFGISRTVVRPALSMLEGDGQLVRIKGRGTFVAPAKTTARVRGLTRTLAEPIAEGVEIRVLDAVEQKTEAHVADLLGIDRRTHVAHVTTVTSVWGRPLVICDSFISPVAAAAVLSLLEGRRVVGPNARPLHPVKLDRSQVTIQTSFCSEFEAEQLEITAGALVVLIRCVEYLAPRRGEGRRAVEVARVVYRADVVELDAELT
jgi:DNA-binding GntR family transcriptional regulator